MSEPKTFNEWQKNWIFHTEREKHLSKQAYEAGQRGSKYFDTGKTTEDWDKMERELAEARALLYKASHHSEHQEEIEEYLERAEIWTKN